MRILHISNKPIFPLIDGGCKAMNQTLNSLMRLSKVKHICLSTYKHPFNIDGLDIRSSIIDLEFCRDKHLGF